MLISAIVAAGFASETLFDFGSILGLVTLFVATMGSAVIFLEQRYLRTGKSRSEVLLGNFEILIAELKPLRWGYFRHDALAICRLRILELPDYFFRDESEKPTQPALWGKLAVDEVGSYALVAEDVNGRRMYRIAVAYPREPMIALAKRIKVELDEMRAVHHQQVLEQYPGVEIPVGSRQVPICVGDRFRIASAHAKKPDATSIQLRTSGEKTEILVPRGNHLETVRFLAHRKSLLIERQLLLGKIQTRIAADDLASIQAQGTEHDGSDLVELIIDFRDRDQAQMQRLVLLQDCTFEEVAWVAAELRDACPPLCRPNERPKKAVARFSIAQIMFLTLLVAAICAPFSLSRKWGWFYAIQLVAALFCVTSFTGARSLGRITKRSWTIVEIAIVVCFLFFMWFVRLISWINGN